MQRRSNRFIPVTALALAFGLLTAPNARAQSAKKIIVLGSGNSAVISGIAKTRTRVDAKELVRVAKERKEKLKTAEEERAETKKRLKAQLQDVDAVAVDFSAASTSEDDGLLAQAALEAGVPLVLENTDGDKMAQLTGAFGLDAKTIVIETTEGGGLSNITVVDGPEPTVQSGPKQLVPQPEKPPAEKESLKEALKQYEARQKAAGANQATPGSPPVNARLTSAQKMAAVEKLISEKAFKKGARRHALLTGTCDGIKCRENQLNMLTRFCPGTGCTVQSTLEPIIEWGVYKTTAWDGATGKTIEKAYIVTRAGGRSSVKMAWDAVRNRGFYVDSWTIKMAGAFPANMGWALEKATPENANRQVSVAYNTSFSLSGTSDKTVGFSYTGGQTLTINTEEFGITRSTTTNSASWTSKMQLDGLAEPYSVPADLFIYWFLSTTDVAPVPTIARLGPEFRAEAIWNGKRGAVCGQCIVTITPTFSLQLYHAWSVEENMNNHFYWKTYTEGATASVTSPLKLVTHWQ